MKKNALQKLVEAMSLVASRYATVSAYGLGPGEATELRNED